MSNRYKMVFIDLDGTTLNNQSEVSPRTQKVLEHLDANGVPVVITTGRSIYSIRQVFAASSIQSPVITLNGTVVFEDLFGSLKDYQAISDDILQEFFNHCRENDDLDNLLLEGLTNYYALQTDHDMENTFIRIRQKYPTIISLDHRLQEPITNLLLRALDNKDRAYAWFRERMGGRLKFVNSSWSWIEVVNPLVNKGTTMVKMAQIYGISVDEVIAFGDEWNDHEMIELAGLGIAMENGNPDIKAVADEIAPPNDQEGVARMLEEIFADMLVETKYA